MWKKNLFVASLIVLLNLFVVSQVFSQEPGLTDSSWPMLYNNPQLTKVTDAPGPVNVGTSPSWQQDYGICWTTPHQGEDDPNNLEDPYLYVTMKDPTDDGDPSVHTKLRKIRPSDGTDVPPNSPVDLGPTPVPVASSVAPLIIKELILPGPAVERLYTQQQGQLRKWDTDLNEITVSGHWPVLIKNPDPFDNPDLIPYAFVLSSNNRTLIGAASTAMVGPNVGEYAVLFAIDKYDGESTKRTFDIHQWFMDHKCVDSCQAGNDATCNPTKTNCCAGFDCFEYRSDKVLVKNTTPIARDPAPDPNCPNCELVFVLTAGEVQRLSQNQIPTIIPGYLLGIIFDKDNQTFGVGGADPVKWKFEYTPPGSDTSPVVSIHPYYSWKDRIYFVSGKDRSLYPLPTSLYSIRTSDGKKVGQTIFDIGEVPASPVVEYRSDGQVPDGNMIYVHNRSGPTRGFLDTLTGTEAMPETLYCKWRTEFYVLTSGGVAGKSKTPLLGQRGLYYTPFKKQGGESVNDMLYAGAFDPHDWTTLTPDSTDPCQYIGSPVWQIPIGESAVDQCTRSIGQDNTGKPQVYFGTRFTLYAIEEQ